MGPRECMVCGRRGNGVREWGVVMPGGTVATGDLCRQHAEPLRDFATKGLRERRVIGVRGLDQLVDTET